MTAPTRRVVVASGDLLFARAVAEHLEAEEGWSAATAEDGVMALGVVARRPPEAVLVLGDLPRLDAARLARQVHLRWPDVRVVAVGVQTAPEAATMPADAGADAVAAALAGAGPVAPGAPGDDRSREVALVRTLTRRELVILRLLAEGHGAGEIAERLKISPHTVRTHTQNLYAKLGCHSRLELVRLTARLGLLEGGER
jgi:DNA-binding NarL/FixJ family response regulator